MQIKKAGLFFILFALILCPLLRAEEIVLTLDEAAALALRDNRDLLLKGEDTEKAKLKIAEAKAALLPSLNFTGNWIDTRGLYLKDIASVSSQATLKQYLYTGAKTTNTIKANEYKLAVAGALFDKTKLETVLNVKKTFFTLLLAKEFTDLNKSILENTNRHLESVKARYKAGEASESDILKLDSSLSSIKQALEESMNQAESSLALLRDLLYLNDDVRIRPAAEFIYEKREVAFDEAFLKAMQSRPEIRQYQAQAEADRKAIEIAKADNRPSIYASWDYYSRSTTSLTFSPAKGWQDYNVIGLTFSWPIFDGFATKAKVEQAIVDLKETRLSKEKIIKDIAFEVKAAYLSLKNAIARLGSAESDIKLYADNLSAIKEKYNQGIASQLDFYDAVLKHNIALFNKNEAIYDYIIAKSSFDKATGGL